MQIEQMLPIDEVATAIDAGRRNLSRIDLSGIPASLGAIPASTMAAARDTIPGPWSRPKPRWRWPLVGVLLVLATAVVGLTFLAPALRRRVQGEPAAAPTMGAGLDFDSDLKQEAAADAAADAAGELPLDGFAYLADRPVSAS